MSYSRYTTAAPRTSRSSDTDAYRDSSEWYRPSCIINQMPTTKRCTWVSGADPLMLAYHDTEWGVPVHDDRKHFEFLVLEGAQAGLSWAIVLNKREGYRRAFSEFDPVRVARYTNARIEKLTLNPAIIRNRMKIEATISNARAFLAIQKEFG